MEQMQQHVQDLIALAKKRNLDAFEVEGSVENGFSASARCGEVENLEHHREKSISISVFKDQKTGHAASSDLSSTALLETLEKACSIANFTEPDSFSGLADKELMAYDYPDLLLNHPWDISHQQAIELAVSCDKAAREYDQRITQTEEAALTTSSHYRVYANSHGFIGDYASTLHGLSISVVAEKNNQKERDYDYCYVRNAEQLDKPKTIANLAAMRAIRRLDARKIKTQKCPVIFDSRVAKSILSHLLGAISGANLYRQSSFLLDHLGKLIMPKHITIGQHPHLKSGYGSAPFDDQGVKTRAINFIENGVLASYMLGAYSARKLGLTTTGNAGGVYNLSISHEDKTLDALCRQMGTGLLVTELMGQGVSLLTGDYSRGAAGFWVENGEIQYPVHEITIASNLKDMLLNIAAVANDIDVRGNIHTGSILVEEMMIAGS